MHSIGGPLATVLQVAEDREDQPQLDLVPPLHGIHHRADGCEEAQRSQKDGGLRPGEKALAQDGCQPEDVPERTPVPKGGVAGHFRKVEHGFERRRDRHVARLRDGKGHGLHGRPFVW